MTNSREFLNADFEKRRSRNSNFSLRSYAKWLGISPAQLSQMMTGKRTISLKTLKKLSEKIGLSPFERKSLFRGLLNESDLIKNSNETKKLHLKEDQFRLISDWYHMAILSLTKIPGASSDPRWIAARLGIKVEEASQAVLRLTRLGILRTTPDFTQVGDPIEVVSEVPSEAIRKFHRQNLSLAIEKLDLVPNHLRQYQSISVAVDPKTLPAFKVLIDDFLEQAGELAEECKAKYNSRKAESGRIKSEKEKSIDEIYQMNVQFYPVTKIRETTK